MVNRSLTIWQGCMRSVRPLMIGIVGMPGELLDGLLGEGPDHDGIEVARHDPRRICDGLAPSQLRVAAVEVDGEPAQLIHPDLEGKPRSRRGFVEDHPQRLSGQGLVDDPVLQHGLQIRRMAEDPVEIPPRQIVDTQKIFFQRSITSSRTCTSLSTSCLVMTRGGTIRRM